MNKEEIKLHEVIYDENENRPVQFFGRVQDNGLLVQDIHTRRYITHKSLVREATKEEVEYFATMDEHIKPLTPKN